MGWASTNSTSGAGFSIAGTAASQSGDFAQNWSPLGHSLGANFNFTAAADTASVRELEAGSLGENTVTHSATGAFTFADVDTLDTHTVSVQAGAAGYIGSLVASVKESTHQVNWTYTASDADMARLAAGQIVTQTYTLVLDDGHGGTVSKVVSVRLGGANDKPIIVTVDSGLAGTVNELADGAAGENIDTLSATGVLSFTDADLGSTHTASVVAQGAGYLGNLTLGALDEASGKLAWTFAVGDGAVDFLNEGETRSQSYLVTITDDKGATVTQVITVTLQGAADASSNPAPIITSTSVDAAGSVVESGVGVAGQSVTQGTLAATDALGTEWSGNANGTYGQFAIDASGHWTYTLDNSRSATQALKAGEVKTETFRAVVTDSSGANTFQNVTVTITGTNDAPVISMPVVANTLPSTVIQTWSTTGSSFAISDSAFRLVDGSSQAGALFGDRPFDLSANFSMAFSLNIAGNFAGNDGLAFVLQSSAAHADAIGAGGTGLGALGIADGIALVFDTTTNLALGYDTAQFVRTSDFTPLSAAFVLGNIQGGYLQYTLDWNATTGKLSLIAGGYATQVSLTLTKAQLDTLFGGSAASVYAGVTAAANSSESGTVSVGVISEVGLPADHAALMPVTVEDTTFAQVVAASLGAGSLGENDIKSVKFAMSAASHAAGDVLWFAGSAFLLEGSYPNRIFSPSGTTMTIGGQSVRFQIDGITHALVMTATSGGTLSDAAVEQAIKALSYSTASDTPIQGQHDVVITLTDTANASASLTAPVMVQSVNDYVLLKQATSYAVVEDSGNVSIDLLTNASDPEGKPMAVGYVGGTGIYWNDTFVTLSSDHRTGIVDTSYGLFQSLAKGQIGTYSIWVYVSDGQNTSTFVEALNVTGANDAPYLATGAVLSANVTERVDGAADENTGNLVTSGTIKYTDVDTIDTHSLSFVPAASGYLGTLSTSIDQANDTIHWNFSVAAGALDTLAAGQTLTQTYNITLTDNNGASIVTPFTVTLVGNNDAPVAVADAGATTQNASVTIDVLANDTDVDQGALLTLASASVASGQGSAMVIDGKLVFDTGHDFDHLADGASQSVSVTYVVLDEFGATSSGVATVTVTGTNDAPVAVADGAGTLQGEAVTVDVLANDTDIDDGAVLSLVSAQVDGVAQGSVAVVDGKLVFDPGHDFDHLADGVSQTVTISYVTSDEHGAQAQGSLDVTVTGTNEAPVAVADVADATQGQPVTIDVIANDTDGDDGAVLHLEGAAVAGGADMGLVTLSGDQLIFTSGAHFDALGEGQTGTASITYDLVDEFGAHSTGSLDVTVTGVNDAPTITSAPDQATGTITLGNGLSAEGHLAGADVDTGDTLTFTGSAQGIYGDFTVDDLGNWTYALHDGVVLPDEADVEEHFAAVLTDSYGATVTQDVTISLVHALANVGDVLV